MGPIPVYKVDISRHTKYRQGIDIESTLVLSTAANVHGSRTLPFAPMKNPFGKVVYCPKVDDPQTSYASCPDEARHTEVQTPLQLARVDERQDPRDQSPSMGAGLVIGESLSEMSAAIRA